MGPGKQGLSKAYILRAAEDSLKRLQTDYIDLYQSHRDDPDTPLEETLEAYSGLMEQGKVRVIGASNYSAERLRHALEVSKGTACPGIRASSLSIICTIARSTKRNLSLCVWKTGWA
jgi:aryl-alcohol dehydrogenase-like predicted oxidoreductase